MWYLYMLVGLTFITPYLRQLVAVISRRALLYLILGSFIIAAGEFAYGGRVMTFLPSFLPFTGYFLAGYYIANLDYKPKKRIFIPLILLCGLVIALATGALLPSRDIKAYDLTYSYHNLLVVIMSLSIFLLLIKAPPMTGLLQRIAPITLGCMPFTRCGCGRWVSWGSMASGCTRSLASRSRRRWRSSCPYSARRCSPGSPCSSGRCAE